jgi:hypothetical protein
MSHLRHCVSAGEPLNEEVIYNWEEATGIVIKGTASISPPTDTGTGTVLSTRVVDPNSFFSDWDPQIIFFRIRIRIRILRLIFGPQMFLNGASNCFHI